MLLLAKLHVLDFPSFSNDANFKFFLILKFVIVVRYTQHKFTILTTLITYLRGIKVLIYSYCETHFQKFFILQNWNSIPINNSSPYPSSPRPLQPPLSFPIEFDYFDTLHTWNHRAFLFSCVISQFYLA